MDQNSKSIAASVCATIFPEGARRNFAKLAGVLIKPAKHRDDLSLERIYLIFQERSLIISPDDEFFTSDRIHLEVADSISLEERRACIDVSHTKTFNKLIGKDLDAIKWEILAGQIDQFIVLEFTEHKATTNKSTDALTIKGDDFHLYLFIGAPIFPGLAFNPNTTRPENY